MNYIKLHKNTKLTPFQRQEIRRLYCNWAKVSHLAKQFNVSRPTIYKVIKRARNNDFTIHKSTNHRYRTIYYGFIRLAKIERSILEKKNKEARRYNKSYPGEMIHIDTKLLPPIKGSNKREYLFVAIDDYSRELYCGIYPDKTAYSAAMFLKQVIQECPYKIECIMTDNWSEYQWSDKHEFVRVCKENWIKQVFTKPGRPQTNWKAERVIRTLMDMWHNKKRFISSEHRMLELQRFVNWYNSVKPHKSLWWKTPFEVIKLFYHWKPI